MRQPLLLSRAGIKTGYCSARTLIGSEQSIPDFFNREVVTGPDPEGLSALIEQHGQTVLGIAAAG